MGRLKGKVAVITGAASGMGEAHARLFVKEGAKVVFTDVQLDKGKAIEKELGENALFLEHDVTKEDQWIDVIKKAEEAFGPVNVLVNNAGIGGEAHPLEDYDNDNYDKVIAINQTGTYFGMKHAVPSMKKTKAASIINISSASGLAGSKNMFAYVTSKFAVRGMAKAAAVELGEFNIRANSVHPGLIETPLVKMTEESSQEMADMLDVLRKENPLKRGAEPEEVSDLVVFLASDESGFMTGAEFVIDGGKFAVQ